MIADILTDQCMPGSVTDISLQPAVTVQNSIFTYYTQKKKHKTNKKNICDPIRVSYSKIYIFVPWVCPFLLSLDVSQI